MVERYVVERYVVERYVVERYVVERYVVERYVVERYVVDLEEIDKTQLALAGGKAAHVGELLHIDGIRVPAGICVTTIAFRRFMASVPGIEERTGQDREAPRIAGLDQTDRRTHALYTRFPFV